MMFSLVMFNYFLAKPCPFLDGGNATIIRLLFLIGELMKRKQNVNFVNLWCYIEEHHEYLKPRCMSKI